jgi:hypothetical protein
MWYKTFYTLVYYILVIIPYLLHAAAVTYPHCEFIPEEGL